MRAHWLLLTLAACGSDPAITSISINPTHAKATEKVTMTLEIENFELGFSTTAAALRAAHGDGDVHDTTGHVHVYFDNLETNPLVQTASTTFQLGIPGDATPGAHKLIARLHRGDHTILEPSVTAEVALTVDP